MPRHRRPETNGGRSSGALGRGHLIALVAAALALIAGAAVAAVLLGAAYVAARGDDPPARAAIAAPLGLPLSFERNVGQAERDVRFLAHGPGGTLYLARSEAVVALRAPDGVNAVPDVLRMRLLGADRDATITGGAPQRATANYLVGDEPVRWRTGVPTYAEVSYRGVYRGTDLVYHAARGQLEYDFRLAPGADPGRIGLEMNGARALRLDDAGRLHVELAHRTLVQEAPVVYQVRDGVRRAVSGRYVLRRGHRVGFAIGAYDRSRPLTIDPKIAFSTYLGGSGNDVGNAVAVDSAGNAYVIGSTTSANLKLHGRPGTPTRRGGIDALVVKIDPAGRLVWSTYLGGSAYTDGRGIAVDRGGHVYLTGATGSRDFPTTMRAPQPDYGGGPYDAYVAKLDASGRRLLYSTFNGGPFNDRGYAIAVDATGTAVATGRTAHDGFPTVGRLAPGPEGGAFVTKITSSGGRIVYSAVLGGKAVVNSSNTGFAVALDRMSNAYVTGVTRAPDFPVHNALQPRYGGGASNAFVTKIDPAGGAIAYSTYLGGGGEDEGLGIAVDRAGAAYVTGQTSSDDFPIAGARLPGTARSAGADAFVAKLSASGTAFAYSLYLGGSAEDGGSAIAVGADGNAHVTGRTASADFPLESALQPRLAGAHDAFVTALSRDGSSLVGSTYLGGTGSDAGLGIALDGRGGAYVTGQTESADFPVLRPLQRALRKRAPSAGGGGSAFLTRVTTTTAALSRWRDSSMYCIGSSRC